MPHGVLSSADTSHCNFVRINCIQGYNLIGESALTCCNGTWSATPPTCHKGWYFDDFNVNLVTKISFRYDSNRYVQIKKIATGLTILD